MKREFEIMTFIDERYLDRKPIRKYHVITYTMWFVVDRKNPCNKMYTVMAENSKEARGLAVAMRIRDENGEE